MRENITLAKMLESLRPFLGYGSQVDLLSRMPFSRRAAALFIEKHQTQLEERLQRKLIVTHAAYLPSGRGRFGRSKGGQRSVTTALSVNWGTKT